MRLQSLKVKLVACFFAISLSAALVGFMANSSLGRVGALLDDATGELVSTLEVLGQLRSAFSQAVPVAASNSFADRAVSACVMDPSSGFTG